MTNFIIINPFFYTAADESILPSVSYINETLYTSIDKKMGKQFPIATIPDPDDADIYMLAAIPYNGFIIEPELKTYVNGVKIVAARTVTTLPFIYRATTTRVYNKICYILFKVTISDIYQTMEGDKWTIVHLYSGFDLEYTTMSHNKNGTSEILEFKFEIPDSALDPRYRSGTISIEPTVVGIRENILPEEVPEWARYTPFKSLFNIEK